MRDRAMSHLCFARGLRVSELVLLRLADVALHLQARILVHGKWRRQRYLALWKVTATVSDPIWGFEERRQRRKCALSGRRTNTSRVAAATLGPSLSARADPRAS
jgi:site-specific recombinase XerD